MGSAPAPLGLQPCINRHFRNLRLRFNYRSQMSQLTVTHPMIRRRAHSYGMPIIWNWAAAFATPFNRHADPTTKIRGGAISLQGAQFGNAFGWIFFEAGQRGISGFHRPLPFIGTGN